MTTQQIADYNAYLATLTPGELQGLIDELTEYAKGNAEMSESARNNESHAWYYASATDYDHEEQLALERAALARAELIRPKTANA